MNDHVPLLSIGLPVYNGERYLREAIDSILNQTYSDFELIISDNASTDLTGEICKAYGAQDTRVRYHRNSINIGGGKNTNQTYRMARGTYFRWAAYDDVCAPELFAKCIAVLEKDSSVVLCHSIVVEIDEHGKPLETLDRNKGGSEKPHERLRNLSHMDYTCEEIYGIVRSDILRKTDLLRHYTDSDRTLLCQLALYGKFHQVSEPLFFRRIHPAMSTKVYSGWRQRMAWTDEHNLERITLPHCTQFLHYLGSIARAPLKRRERLLCYLQLIRWLGEGGRVFGGHARWMMGDLIHGAQLLITLRMRSRNRP